MTKHFIISHICQAGPHRCHHHAAQLKTLQAAHLRQETRNALELLAYIIYDVKAC